MGGCHCRGPNRKNDGYYDSKQGFNIDIAKQAVKASVAVLNPRDIVSVVMFDDIAALSFPPQQGATPDAVMSAIAPAKPSGSTNINAGLALAQQTLNQSNAGIKHIILFTDGLGQNGDTLTMAQQFAKEGITISMGTDGNTPWGPHLEMADMVATGMSPADVLVSATKNSAAFLKLDDAGTVAAGKIGSFIVLEANPLDDIANTRKIRDVYLRGEKVDRSAY
jgi:secreted protein with Ig-like and vWFA domain